MEPQTREKYMQTQYPDIFQTIKRSIMLFSTVFVVPFLLACSNAGPQPEAYILRRTVKLASETGGRNGIQAALPVIEEIDQIKAKDEFDRINVETLLVPLEERLLIKPVSEDIPQSIIDVFEKDAIFKDAYFDFDIRLSEYNLCTHSQDIDGWEKYEHANVYWSKYTVIDLDRDGTNELVYLVDLETGGGQYVIFHDIDGIAYSFRIPFRSMAILRIDGTAESTGGASDGRWYRITRFERNRLSAEILGIMSSWSFENGEEIYERAYYVGNRKVTEEYFYDVFIPEIDAKEPVKWIEP